MPPVTTSCFLAKLRDLCEDVDRAEALWLGIALIEVAAGAFRRADTRRSGGDRIGFDRPGTDLFAACCR